MKQTLPGVKGSIPTGALHAKNTRVCPPHGTHYNQVGRVRFAYTSDKSNGNSLQELWSTKTVQKPLNPETTLYIWLWI